MELGLATGRGEGFGGWGSGAARRGGVGSESPRFSPGRSEPAPGRGSRPQPRAPLPPAGLLAAAQRAPFSQTKHPPEVSPGLAGPSPGSPAAGLDITYSGMKRGGARPPVPVPLRQVWGLSVGLEAAASSGARQVPGSRLSAAVASQKTQPPAARLPAAQRSEPGGERGSGLSCLGFRCTESRCLAPAGERGHDWGVCPLPSSPAVVFIQGFSSVWAR